MHQPVRGVVGLGIGLALAALAVAALIGAMLLPRARHVSTGTLGSRQSGLRSVGGRRKLLSGKHL